MRGLTLITRPLDFSAARNLPNATLPRTMSLMNLSLLACVPALAGLAFVTSAVSQDADNSAPVVAERPPAPAVNIDVLKARAGKWYQVDENGAPTDQLVSEMRVTAGGNAVLELLFPGTPNEMVTVYYQDGNTLMLTHYCVANAHPQMICNSTSTPERLVFDCNGGANIIDANTGHMHSAVIEMGDSETMSSEWTFWAQGEKQNAVKFDLVRVSDRK
jgi:hypothetical protein